jgi:hypothetical protein
MPKGSKKGGGLEVKKEYKSKGMPYAPFKMSGHTLPGPNQSSALKNLPMTPRSEELNTGNLSGMSPGMQALFSKSVPDYISGKRHKKNIMGSTEVGENYEGGEDYSAIKEAENTQPYVNSGIGDNDVSAVDGDVTKKKVDVEVTVNDKKI